MNDILMLFDKIPNILGVASDPISPDVVNTMHSSFLICVLTVIFSSFGLLHYENSSVSS
jgi:hypothetical protein